MFAESPRIAPPKCFKKYTIGTSCADCHFRKSCLLLTREIVLHQYGEVLQKRKERELFLNDPVIKLNVPVPFKTNLFSSEHLVFYWDEISSHRIFLEAPQGSTLWEISQFGGNLSAQLHDESTWFSQDAISSKVFLLLHKNTIRTYQVPFEWTFNHAKAWNRFQTISEEAMFQSFVEFSPITINDFMRWWESGESSDFRLTISYIIHSYGHIKRLAFSTPDHVLIEFRGPNEILSTTTRHKEVVPRYLEINAHEFPIVVDSDLNTLIRIESHILYENIPGIPLEWPSAHM